MTAEWSEEFETLVRAHLPLLGDGEPLTSDVALADLGLDSLSTVGLLVEIEESFGVRFPDDELTPATFSTAGVLWSVVTRLGNQVAR